MHLFRRNLSCFSKLKTLLANETIPKYKERKPHPLIQSSTRSKRNMATRPSAKLSWTRSSQA